MNSLLDHRKEFLIKAAMHAKHVRLKELNSLETDIMIAENLLHELKSNNYPEHVLLDYSTEIKAIRRIIKEKKLKII
jgi:hypothetical protein